MEQWGLPQHATTPASPSASSGDSISSSRRDTQLGNDTPPASLFFPSASQTVGEEDERMSNGGGVERGKEKVEEGLTGAGILRSLGVTPTTEIEEAPPSPPPPSRRGEQQRLLDVDAEVAAALACGLAAEAGRGLDELRRKETTLARLMSRLQQLRGAVGEQDKVTNSGGGGAEKGKEKVEDFAVAGMLRPLGPSPTTEIEEAPPSPPPPSRHRDLDKRLAAVRAATRLRSQLRGERAGAGEGSSSKCPGDAAGEEGECMAVIRQMERQVEMLAGVLDNLRKETAGMTAMDRETELTKEAMKEWDELFTPPTARKNNKNKIAGNCNWRRVVSMIALASGLMLLIKFRTLLRCGYLSHILGALAVFFILGRTGFFRGMFGTSRAEKGFSCHVALLIYICFSLYVLCALYLITDGTFAGLLACQTLVEMETSTIPLHYSESGVRSFILSDD
ncbi:hypothetical protein ACP70R_015350 [Stipagrostis hirtigluma subsp. patula]